MADLPLLSILTFLPALTALVLALLPAGQDRLARVGTLVVTLVLFGLSVAAWAAFDPASPDLQLVERHAWIATFGVHYAMGVDGIALSMIVLTGLLMPLAVLCSWTAITERVRAFHVALLLLEAGMMGVFSATDLFLFYVFWEVMLLPMALLIGIWGGPRRVYAAVKFVLYTMAGSLLMFVAILYCGVTAADPSGTPTFDIATLQGALPAALPLQAQLWLFLAFSLSFAIKVPMFPFHTWLPDAHVEAPTAGSVILAGVLLKMGSYGFLRFAIPFFPAAAVEAAPVMLGLSAVGILYGSFMSMVQSDIKKVIAYSSVAHLGFVMLGIFSGTVEGTQGGVLQMVNHGVSTGALFLLVGVIYERTHTRGVRDFGGLSSVMPAYAVLFLFVSLSSIGLPGLNGFVGEFLILLGTFQTAPVWAALSAVGVILGAVYMLTLCRDMFFGPSKPAQRTLPDVRAIELAALLPLIVLIVALGVMPNPLLAATEGPVQRVVKSFQAAEHARNGAPDPAVVPVRTAE